MSKVLCSIIVPFYDIPAPLVDKCLSSIIGQDWGDNRYEVIFVNDGSPVPLTKSTLLLFDSIEHFHLITQDNRGLSAARNAGIRAASGKYLFFLDSDDYWFPHSIGNLLTILKNENPCIAKFSSRHIFDHDNQPSVSSPTIISTYASGCEYMSEHNIIKGACSYCYLRDFIVGNGIFMPEGIIHEDEWFLTKAFFHAHKVVDTNISLYAYIRREGSITSRKTDAQWNRSLTHFFESIKLACNKRTHIARTPLQSSAIDNRLSYLLLDYIYVLFNSTLSREQKTTHIDALKSLNLFPLPKLGNNLKYNVLRLFSSSYSTTLIFTKCLNALQKLRPQNRNY